MQVDTPLLPSKTQFSWKLLLNIMLTIVLLGVFAWQFSKNWDEMKVFNWQIQWTLVSLALLILLANSLCEVLIWNKTLGWFAKPLPFLQAAPVYIWSALARYIPGKVASLVLRVALAREVKAAVIPVLASSTVELALRTASGLMLLFFVMLAVGAETKGALLYLPLSVIPLVLLCAHPKIMLPVMNWFLRKIKQQPIQRSLRYREVLLVFAATIFRWLLYGAGYGLLAIAIYPKAAAAFPLLVATAAGSWSAGFIGMTPGGVGIAEFVQNFILRETLHFPQIIALMLPVLFRLATLLAEGVWALASIFMRRQWNIAAD